MRERGETAASVAGTERGTLYHLFCIVNKYDL